MSRYGQLVDIIGRIKPRKIVEIGTHRGARAKLMIETALRCTRGRIDYFGFDVFEFADGRFHAEAFNAKGPARQVQANSLLSAISKVNPGRLYWTLTAGDTRTTLAGKSIVADLVFVDGDHRIETIRSDYAAVQGSRCIVLDDLYVPDAAGRMPDISRYGCNALVEGIGATILPVADPVAGGGLVMMALVER